MKLVPGYEYRLNFALDIRVALEAVLVQRLKQQPTTRQHEWLRRLLVLGFREECKTLQQSVDKTVRAAPAGAPVHRLVQEAKLDDVRADKPNRTVVPAGPAHHKPLAALRKVLGEKVA